MRLRFPETRGDSSCLSSFCLATREIYAGIFMIQFPPTKNTILTAPERNCRLDFREAPDQSAPHRTLIGIHRLLPRALHEARTQDLLHPQSAFSAPVPLSYIAPEADCEAERALARKCQRLRKRSRAIFAQCQYDRLTESNSENGILSGLATVLPEWKNGLGYWIRRAGWSPP